MCPVVNYLIVLLTRHRGPKKVNLEHHPQSLLSPTFVCLHNIFDNKNKPCDEVSVAAQLIKCLKACKSL